jgi:hypothetical protein
LNKGSSGTKDFNVPLFIAVSTGATVLTRSDDGFFAIAQMRILLVQGDLYLM